MSQFLALFLSVLLPYLAVAQSPRTFYIGHSLSDQIPDMVQSLSNDHDDVDFSWVYQSIPGAPLRWQWERKAAEDYYPIEPHYYGFYDQDYGLPAGNFDVLVLTEAVPRYEYIIGETYEYADSFYRFASFHNPNLRVYLYEDWHCILSDTPTGCAYDVDSNPWRQRLEDDLPMWESVVDTLNSRYDPENPVCLIPVGQGLATLYDSIEAGVVPDLQNIEDVFSDDIHLTDVGKYYVACIHFAMIQGVSPVGLSNQLHVWWGGDFEAPSLELAAKFQEMAWAVVNSYPNSCLDNITGENVVNADNPITIWPNPAMNVIYLKGAMENSSIQILNANGLIVQKIKSFQEVEIDISHLQNGLHYLRVISPDGNGSYQKFLKNN